MAMIKILDDWKVRHDIDGKFIRHDHVYINKDDEIIVESLSYHKITFMDWWRSFTKSKWFKVASTFYIKYELDIRYDEKDTTNTDNVNTTISTKPNSEEKPKKSRRNNSSRKKSSKPTESSEVSKDTQDQTL